MSTNTPEWLQAVQEADIEADLLRDKAEQVAVRRAHAIWRGVQETGPGGRDAAAAQLGTTVRAVDKAIARAKANPQYSHLPGNLLERLFDLEIADLKPLPADWWTAIAHLVRGTIIDSIWLDAPAELLAADLEEAALDGSDLQGWDTAPIAAAVRTWNRTQTLAVLEAIRQDATDTLPVAEADQNTEPGTDQP
ncbi:hypothetical protein [Kitasatospora sp. NPDC090091]|uniref:hypothetical protein n=1 Tax=Kitasatospora sp. NPDC090091 TaxID=3364081 RepID=UPI003814370A